MTLLAISTDADTALASWARDKDYPFIMLSDLSAEVGKKYGAFITTTALTRKFSKPALLGFQLAP